MQLGKPTVTIIHDQPLDTRQCRICLETVQSSETEDNPLIAPCQCKGSHKWVHRMCVDRWRVMSLNELSLTHCYICKSPYHVVCRKLSKQDKLMYILHLLRMYIKKVLRRLVKIPAILGMSATALTVIGASTIIMTSLIPIYIITYTLFGYGDDDCYGNREFAGYRERFVQKYIITDS